MNEFEVERDTSKPLYLWIESCGSILNVNERSRLKYEYTGKSIVTAVLQRFVSLYKVRPAPFVDIVHRLRRRYGTNVHQLDQDIQKLLYGDYIGFVTLRDNEYGRKEFYAEKLHRPVSYQTYHDALQSSTGLATRLTEFFNEDWSETYRRLAATPNVPEILKSENVVEIPPAHPPGVYFLMQGDEIVYVGQSVSPGARIAQHVKDKNFDRVLLIPTINLSEVETKYIKLLRPKYNISQNYG